MLCVSIVEQIKGVHKVIDREKVNIHIFDVQYVFLYIVYVFNYSIQINFKFNKFILIYLL